MAEEGLSFLIHFDLLIGPKLFVMSEQILTPGEDLAVVFSSLVFDFKSLFAVVGKRAADVDVVSSVLQT